MKGISLFEKNNIHAVGIGGSGLSGLIGILSKYGKNITGSDTESSRTTETFRKSGIKVTIGHSKKNLRQETQFLIHSLAIPKSNPELREARMRHIPILSYPEAVGELTKSLFTIAVSGTHGKSTVTAMISKILIENGFDPTVIIGAALKELKGKNYRTGKNKLLILEACEYKRAFLNYSPRIAVIHTLDPDHLDYYKNFEDYLNAFRDFTQKMPKDGYIFANLDDEDVHKIIQTLQSNKFPPYNIFTYSSKHQNTDFYLNQNSKEIFYKKAKTGPLNLKVPGEHNRINGLAAFGVCATLGITPKNILKSLNNYTGASRRFEIKGKIGKTIVIDDYAHHPSEIQATLSAAKEKFPNGKICVIFQPHQYSRTKFLFDDFSSAFKQASTVIIPNIYEARDSTADKKLITPEKLASAIRRKNPNVKAIYGQGLEKTTKFIKKRAGAFEVIITMGAGDVWKIANQLRKR